jgi:hypothetical protein
MKFVLFFTGFIVAMIPPVFFGVWNGVSMAGLMVTVLVAGFIVRDEVLNLVDGGDDV